MGFSKDRSNMIEVQCNGKEGGVAEGYVTRIKYEEGEVYDMLGNRKGDYGQLWSTYFLEAMWDGKKWVCEKKGKGGGKGCGASCVYSNQHDTEADEVWMEQLQHGAGTEPHLFYDTITKIVGEGRRFKFIDD